MSKETVVFPLPSSYQPRPTQKSSPLVYFCLPQQVMTSSTTPLVSKHGVPNHQHGRPYLLQLVPCMERGPHTLLGCCQLLQVMRRHPSNAIKTLKTTTSLRLLKGGLQYHSFIKKSNTKIY